jgi:hypothetical protein
MEQKKSYEEPTAGVFYLIPNLKTGKYEIYSQFEDAGEPVVHLFLWESVVRKIRLMNKVDIDPISDLYRGLPRGRVIAPSSRDGLWIVGWGNDFPLAQYKSDIISDFQLGDADSIHHVKFEHQVHEEMILSHKKAVEKLLGIEMSPTGFKKIKKK